MRVGVAVVAACLLQIPASACELEPAPPALSIRDLLGPAMDRSLLMGDVPLPGKRVSSTGTLGYDSSFARAIARAAKRSAAEIALEAATKIIVMCQKERNPALTTPFFRSDSQQAHCFRY